VQRALREAGFDTRIVHPYTTKQYRQPADPDDKTDDHDLAAIFRAATQGFGLCEAVWPADYTTLQILRRHRRDLIDKNSKMMCQILEKLHAAMPGYVNCFSCIWDSPVALAVARQTTPAAIKQLGLAGLQKLVADAGLACRQQTLVRILAWAEQAPPNHTHSLQLRLILDSLEDDRSAKCKQIKDLERQLAGLIVQTPSTLLLAIPGINVVTVADLAGEMGPIELYRDANAITGRAGLMPSRYQSDRVDCANGPLRRRGNRRLRGVLMQTADNLVACNHYFNAQADQWRRRGKKAQWIRTRKVDGVPHRSRHAAGSAASGSGSGNWAAANCQPTGGSATVAKETGGDGQEETRGTPPCKRSSPSCWLDWGFKRYNAQVRGRTSASC
jgi:transposase